MSKFSGPPWRGWHASLRWAMLAAVLYSLMLTATAADVPAELRGSEIQIFIENDSFGSSDQYYTNGIKLGGGVPAERVSKFFSVPPHTVLNAITENASNHFGLFVGQSLYTPRDITIAAPQPNDRPWAAWLYIGGVAQSVATDHLHTVEVDIGVVGPPALGRPVQTAWHQLVNAPEPKGWDNQLHTEPGFVVSYLHKRRYGNRTGVQFVPHLGASLGTVMTMARVGGIVRAGQYMSGFGPDGIEPGGAMLKNTREQNESDEREPYEWFVFAGADGRAVAHNIFLDGSLFRDGPSVESKPFVYDLSAGFSVRFNLIRLSVTRILRSEEFTSATGGGGTQQFYSLNIGVEF